MLLVARSGLVGLVENPANCTSIADVKVRKSSCVAALTLYGVATLSSARPNMKAIFVEQPGGVENLRYADLPTPQPGPGQALVKIEASGVNFIDIYFRSGLYKADPPVQLGMEAAGVVESVASDVTTVKPGDRVAYAMARGSHAE